MKPKEFTATFLAETGEGLSDLEHCLVALEENPEDAEHINRVFRVVHTLKSSAGMFNIEPMVAVAHVAENILDRVRSRQLRLDKSLTDQLLRAVDAFREMIERFSEGSPVVLEARHAELIREFESHLSEHALADGSTGERPGKRQPSVPSLYTYEIRMRFAPELFQTGQDPSLLILELAGLGDVLSLAADTSRLPSFDVFNATQCYLGWTAVLRTERPRTAIEDIFLFVSDTSEIVVTDVSSKRGALHEHSEAELKIGELLVQDCAIQEHDVEEALKRQKRLGEILVDMGKVSQESLEVALKKQQAVRNSHRSSTIRVDTDKLDSLVNLVGELAIAVAQVGQSARAHQHSAGGYAVAVESLERIGRDLQTQVMSVRMVSIEETFNRFKRTVRDTAQELGKLVVLETSGTETELDKIVIEQLADPLKHMIRNAIAHGIESPAERIRCGKSDTGRIHLSASQRQGNVIIEVRDDGCGVDLEAVLRKARQRGLVRADQALSEKQILNLLFEPGFSTAEQVNEISGRGVGLDVVMQNVRRLRGTVDIDSQQGKGTTFRIRLPLTLAIIDGMNVKVGQDIMTIPMVSVVELISPRAEQLSTVEGRGELIEVRGEYIPVVRLKEVLEADCTERNLGVDTVVVVVENEQRKFGILVDRVLGLEQAVVKPLQKTFSVVERLTEDFVKPDGLAGATILGNGDVALILDVPGIERMAFGVLQ